MIDRRPYMDELLRERDIMRVHGMTSPVRCNCGQIYDLGKVEVCARYSDCSYWMTPCCHRHEDDRPWTRKYKEIDLSNDFSADRGLSRERIRQIKDGIR